MKSARPGSVPRSGVNDYFTKWNVADHEHVGRVEEGGGEEGDDGAVEVAAVPRLQRGVGTLLQ